MLTALEFVQRVLAAIDEMEVNTISSSVESEQVFLLLKTKYEELLAEYPWHHLQQYGQLEVTPTPHKMKLPNNVMGVDGDLVRYNKRDVYYTTPESMTRILDSRDTTQSSVDQNGARTDKEPSYWTTEDDEYIIFDSYDGTLVASYTKVRFIVAPQQLTADLDKPDLPDRLSNVLLNGVLEEAFRTLKGDEQSATRYNEKYKRGLYSAKKWARRLDREPSTWANDFGRAGTRRGPYISAREVLG